MFTLNICTVTENSLIFGSILFPGANITLALLNNAAFRITFAPSKSREQQEKGGREEEGGGGGEEEEEKVDDTRTGDRWVSPSGWDPEHSWAGEITYERLF